MNQILTTTTDLGQCDMQALETATAIVHLNAPETVTVTATAAETVPATTTSSKLAACDVCGKVFSCYNLERHKRTHRGEKLFSCMVCNRSFSQKSHLTVHERIHTGERPFKCNICGCAFSRKDYLVRHTWTQHSGKVYTINNQTVTPIIHPAKKQRTRKPKTVNVTLTSAVPVTQLATNSTYSPQQEVDQPPLPQLPAPPAAAEDVVVVPQEPTSVHVACKECLKEYTQSQQQQQQQQSSMNFTKSNYEEVPLSCLYVCEVCGKSFQTSSKLSTHCKIHTRPKSFVCDVCQKAFSRRDHLNVHKQIHTGKRPHKCDVCGYAFTRIDHLMRHKRPNKGMRKLSCVPRVLTDMPATDESSTTAALEDDSNTEQAVVSAAVAATATLPTATLPTAVMVPSHHEDSMTQNGQATTITTLTNVPHHVTVQPLYHANISQQLTVPFNPQQLDVATVQIYTATK